MPVKKTDSPVVKELVYTIFEQCAIDHEHHIAIDEEQGEQISYGVLNSRVNKLSHLLTDLGIRKDKAAVVILPSSIRLVTSMLAIFKSAGIYVPADLKFSRKRMQQLLTETNPQVLITAAETRVAVEQLLRDTGVAVPYLVLLPESIGGVLSNLHLDLEGLISVESQEVAEVLARDHAGNYVLQPSFTLDAYPISNPEITADPGAANYIFYTSGSTGAGKGIVGSHRSLGHYIHWHGKEFSITRADRISQLAPVTFDASLKDILVALSTGATLCIPSANTRRNMVLLAEWLQLQCVTVLQTVPSVFRLLTRSMQSPLPKLRQVVLAGEKLYGRDLLKWKEVNGEQAQVTNMYGLTETTILKTCYHVPHWDWQAGESIPVGKPISNTLVAVINEGKLCLRGEIGDIYIKTPYTTRGYLDESLNTSLFVQNPLVHDKQDMICRTGDVGRFGADGMLEVLGRKDEQVKVHGVRIELNEVKKALLELEGIDQVELVLHSDEEYGQELIAYFTGKKRTVESIRLELAAALNEQLIPGFFVWLEEFPLNINGKIDRKQLPRPDELLERASYEEPQGDTEQRLSLVWQQVLGVKRAGRKDSFFTLGGSSLKAIQLISRIYKEFDTQVTIADVFNEPVLWAMAEMINEAQRKAYEPIAKTEEAETYPLTHAQHRLWLVDQRQQETLPFNGLEIYKLKGILDRPALEAAFIELMERHESLRTVFQLVEGEPRQRILPVQSSGFALELEDIRQEAGVDEHIKRRMAHEFTLPFKLDKGPLFRVSLLQCADDEHILFLASHHIVSDEWSRQVMMREIVALYNTLHAGQPAALPPLPIQYKDYAAWQLQQLSGENLAAHRAYWLNKFAGEIPVLELPADHPRPAVQTYKGEHVFFRLPVEATERLQQLCKQENASLFMALTAVVRTLLYRYSGQPDIILGSPVAGRDHPDLEDLIGYFLNTIALRNKIEGDKGFLHLLKQEKETVLKAFSHQVYPFDRLVEELGLANDVSRSPLFDVAIILQNIQLNKPEHIEMSGIEASALEPDIIISKGDLRFQFAEDHGHIKGNIEYNTDLYSRSRIERMIVHLQLLLDAVTADPEQPLREVAYRTEDELRDEGSFATILPAMPQQPVPLLFEQMAKANAAGIAVNDAGEEVSYATLQSRVHQLAGLLQEIGLQKGDAVVTMLSSGARLVSSMLGVFMNGGVYVPADTNFSQRRLQQLFAETRPRVLITGSEQKEAVLQLVKELKLELPFIVVLPASGKGLLSELQIDLGDVVEMEAGLPEVMQFANGNYNVIPVDETNLTPATIDPDAACYIFYTSGSTGTGKGIAGTHRSLSHYVQWHINEFGVSVNDRISQLAPVTFDASLKDILVALCAGATLCVPSASIKNNMPLLAEWMQQQQVSILQTVPSVFRLLTRSLKSPLPKLRQVVLAGERLYGRDVMKFKEVNGDHARISNLYGLTETTILKTCYHLPQQDWQPGETIPVGVAIAGTLIAVMQENQPCLGGEIGEVFIKSPYFTLGYLDQSLNENMFIQNPLVNGRKDIVCRTGDIGRLRADGTLEVLGRKDEQVKLHGVRVELNEVKKALLELEGVDQVELLVHNDDDYGQELVAYYTGRKRTAEALRAELKPVLNEQLLPGYFVWLQEFPLNINGKVDRKQLPRPDELLERGQYEEPQGATEQALALIWQQVLGVKRVGRKDSFFNLGGSSLKAIQLISRIYKEQDVQITIAEVFNAPVLSDMAALVDQAQRAAYEPIERAPEQDTYPLTHAQRRLWILDQLNKDMIAYSRPNAFHLQGKLKREALEAAFISLVERHESLRTVFEMVEGEPRQRILPVSSAGFTPLYEDLRTTSDIHQSVQEIISQATLEGFDLQRGPLIRIKLLQLAEEEFVFLLAVHHIVSDEWSMQVLIKEVLTLYNAYCKGESNSLSPLPIQYKDYAVWQQQQLAGEKLEAQRKYWLEKLSGELPVLELQGDNTRPPAQTFNGAQIATVFSAEERAKLQELCAQTGATMFMGLLALLKAFLYKYSAQQDIIIGSPVAGRDRPDLEGQIGIFVNTLCLRTQLNESQGFRQLLLNVKQTAMGAFDNQGYPFDKLVDELNLTRDLSRNPLFDVAMVMRNVELNTEAELQMNEVEVRPSLVDVITSLYDLTFWFGENEQGIALTIEYNTDIYHRPRIERMALHLQHLLKAMLNQPDEALLYIDYLPEEERAKILCQFNTPATETPLPSNFPQLFEAQAEADPSAVAAICGNESISYEALQHSAHQIAYYLIQHHGAQQGQLIGLLMERSPDLPATILGILETGAAYLPIDPVYPAERIEYILSDANAQVVISDRPSLLAERSWINLNDIRAELAACSTEHPGIILQPGQPAYIMYTSGSTGKPKGAIISHGALLNYLLWANEFYFSEETAFPFAVFTSLAFDLTVTSIMTTLLRGDAMHLYSSNDTPQVLREIFANPSIRAIKLTPSHINLVKELELRGPTGINTVIVGGEALTMQQVETLHALNPQIKVYNEYGPTETTVGCSAVLVLPDQRITIGKPISNVQMFVVNEQLQLQPIGVNGEICIGGAGVAEGYHNQPALTEQKFIPNPFGPGKLYRTGDIGHWLADGELLLSGRRDEQVKIRGYRIEPAEIEAVLSTHPQVTQAVVVAIKNNNEQSLVGYFTAANPVEPASLRTHWRQYLPEYMIPAWLVQLEQIPLTPNGKLDKKALPEPQGRTAKEYIAPRTTIEKKLAAIWRDVLNREQVGLADNFFEMGGHSLKAVQVMTRVYKEISVKLDLKDLFVHATLRELAELVANSRRQAYEPIAQAPRQETYALSHAQKRLWILNQFEEVALAYYMAVSYRLKGQLDLQAFNASFHSLVDRHESLRTIFELVEGEPRQRIKTTAESGFAVDYRDLSGEANAEAAAQEDMRAAVKPFDLQQGPLLRVKLTKVKEGEFLFMLFIHHIVSDEWSMQVLVRELLELYNAHHSGQPAPLTPLPLQYKDYAAWQQQELSGEKLQLHQQYWLDKFSGELPVLNIPGDKPRPKAQTYRGEHLHFMLPKELSEGFTQLYQQSNATLFMAAMALIKTLLYRYTNEKDIIIGFPVAGREHPDLEDQIGFYVNTLALRTQLDVQAGFVQLLEQVKQNALEAYSHQVYPFDKLVDELNLTRDMSRSPLFDIMVTAENATGDDENNAANNSMPGIDVEDNSLQIPVSMFDMTFFFRESREGLQLKIEYNTDIYDAGRIERMAAHLQELVHSIISNPVNSISTLSLLPPQETELLLHQFNQPALPVAEETIHSIFERNVQAFPDAAAVVFGDAVLTYSDLNKKANQLADYLVTSYNIQPGDFAAIWMERSEWFIIALLGVLKTGAAYVPIDTAYPADRVNYMLADSEVKLLIGDENFDAAIPCIPLREAWKEIENCKTENLEIEQPASALAYVIYTSGSTGKPKGVMIEHRSVVELCRWHNDSFAIDIHSRAAMYAGIGFDASAWETWPYLLGGACLYPVAASLQLELDQLANWIDQSGITHIFLPTAVCRQLAGTFQFNGIILTGGDELGRLNAGDLNIVNNYGPTESTVVSTSYPLQQNTLPEKNIPIGKPIRNRRIYVVNDQLQLQPIGVPGEILIAGAGLARGYLHQPGLTTEKFLHYEIENGVVYRSGDLGRWLPDGNLEFLGRKDEQVKIRGYRVELAEIEHVLLEHQQVTGAVITTFFNHTEKQLCAYFTATDVLQTAELRNWLSKQLPEYMLPGSFVQLETIPLTPNGKIDKKALPDPIGSAAKEYIAPSTPIEIKLAGIWQEVLNRERVGMSDNFFELGGHSLKAVQVMSRIYKELSVKLELKSLFTHSVLSDLARLVESSATQDYRPIEKAAEQDTYPLSHAQRRLWVLNEFEEVKLAYIIPMSYRFAGALDGNALAAAFQALVARHESLRTVFKVVNGEPRQFILPADQSGFAVDYRDLRNEPDPELAAQQAVKEASNDPFDLQQGPLLRVKLLRIKDDEHLFLLNIHHIISDEWSINVLVREVLAMYDAIRAGQPDTLKPLPIQYKDYAAWQLEELSGKSLAAHQQYWLNTFAGELPVLQLPGDNPRPTVKTYNGRQLYFRFSKAQHQQLLALGTAHNATLFMSVVALVKSLLYRYTGQQDIIIGSPVAGREHPDLDNQIGFYVNTLALRTQFNGNDSFTAILEQVKQNALNAYTHQSYPFDRLVDELELNRDLSRSALFDVMVSLENMEQGDKNAAPALDGTDIADNELSVPISKFDMTFHFVERPDGMGLSIEYNTDIYHEPRILRMGRHLQALLDAVLQNPEQPLNACAYLNNEEVNRLLHEYSNTTGEPGGKIQLPANTVVELFEERVAQMPERIALVAGERNVSYKELNAKANQLAHYLRTVQQVQPEEIIGLRMERNEWMVIALLGILKSGAAYLPIDLNYPEERVAFLLRNSKVKTVLQNELPALESYPTTNLDTPAGSQLAYVIYTSGSTGEPKGVMVEHQSVVNTLLAVGSEISIVPTDKLLAVTTHAFDMSVVEIFLPLISGAQLLLASNHDIRDASMLSALIAASQPTIMQATPGLWNMLVSQGWEGAKNLRIISGGEAIPSLLAEKLLQECEKVWNMYGPTEVTVYATQQLLQSPDDVALIGKPLNNTYALILDDQLQLVPEGIPGTLYVGGAGLARGYLNRPDLTAERFIINPFNPDEKLYNTGDRCSWTHDGRIRYFGRNDDQVKIRGYRIEPGEVEQVLLSAEGVQQGVVVCRQKREEKFLVAYYTAATALAVGTLRAFMKTRLPDYMIPSWFVQLESMPVTTSGKIDKKALPEPEGKSEKNYEAPRNVMEEKLVAIWMDVLDRKQIGVYDNFFELGGHSLKAVQMMSAVNKALGASLNLKDVLSNPTVAEMAKVIAQGSYMKGKLINLNNFKPGKRAIYFTPPLIGTSIVYMSLAVELEEKYNCFGLQDAGFDIDEPFDDTVEKKVNRFAEEIKAVHSKEEEAIIFGFSFAALIAYEVGRLLEKEGYKIRLIVLDSPIRTRKIKRKRKEHKEEDMKSLDADFLWSEGQLRVFGLSDDEVKRVRKLWLHNISLSNEYLMSDPLDGDIIAFKARNNTGKDFMNMKQWAKYTRGKFAHHYLLGDHYDVLRLPKNLVLITNHLFSIAAE